MNDSKSGAGFLSVLLALLLFAGCTPSIPLSKKFYNTKKVGIILEINDIGIAKAGAQGLLDMVLTPGNRFKEPLKKIEAKLDLEKMLEEELSTILSKKNKPFVFLDKGFSYQDLPDFSKPRSTKKFPKKDFRDLSEPNEIDEVLYVNVKYGLLVSYYGFIETGKQGYARISTQVVDLADNSLLQAQTIQTAANIKGNWKSGVEYENLNSSIQEAINKSLDELDTRF